MEMLQNKFSQALFEVPSSFSFSPPRNSETHCPGNSATMHLGRLQSAEDLEIRRAGAEGEKW